VVCEKKDHDLQLPLLVDEIRRRHVRLVGFQIPDGLKRHIPTIRETIEADTDAVPVFCTEPCFGGCDLSTTLPLLGCDLIVHMGHSRMIEDCAVPVIYVPCFSERSPREILESDLGSIPIGRVGLVSTIQHARDIPEVSQILSDKGYEVYVGDHGSRTELAGQVLGCNYDSAKAIAGNVDSFVYIGGGNFHPLGVAMATGKPVFVVDPYAGEIREIDSLKKRALAKRFAQIEKARGSKSFGLIVSTKPGQIRIEEAIKCRESLRSMGHLAAILSSDRLDPGRLVLHDFDAYVNFGCPRMAVEDSELFPKAVLTPQELEILLGNKPWEEYAPDEIT
jgi:2-(3-amino-3-carboxypropyl)histidine synthase